ncbi:hypothetical protein [Paraburkholderia phenoliruptrix]|uniref:Uncharacterized protein n=1 Tax=Paraburkholderia phenoliruptrix TaxID=252970 RepID=A0ABV3W789_9BURK
MGICMEYPRDNPAETGICLCATPTHDEASMKLARRKVHTNRAPEYAPK